MAQINFSELNQMKGACACAKEMNSPILLGTSESESKFFGLEEAVALRNVLQKRLAIPIFLNLDHGKDVEYIRKAIDAGYDMVHYDGSKHPLTENIKNLRTLKKHIGWKDVLIEGEVGRIGNESSRLYNEKFMINEDDLTKPEEAQKYMNDAKPDLLAVSIGNFHGIEASGIDPNLRLDRLDEIREKIGKNVPIVLHGGSGTPEDDIRNAIKRGIVKINVNTEVRLAFTGNLRRALSADPEEIVPYKYLVEPQKSVSRVTKAKIKLFGSEGKI